MSAMIVRRQQVLSGISRYNLTWAATQSVAELLRLEQAVAVYSIPGSDLDKDEVGLRLDILANRVEVIQHGEADELLQQDPELQSIVRDLAHAVDAAGRLMAELDRPGPGLKLLDLLTPLNAKMALLAARAHAFSGDSVARDQQELERLHWILSGLLISMIVAAFTLLALLFREAGVIRRAHDNLRGLTEELGHAAQHDALTGLPNRVLLYNETKRAIEQQRNNSLAVLFLDLDHFKEVNDTLGHSAGDLLLELVGQRLKKCVRPSDVVARLSGDEFAILLPVLDEVGHIARVTERIIEMVSAPYSVEGQQAIVGTSVGIAMCPRDGLDADELLRNADIALYKAKAEGRATYRFYHPDMHSELQHQRALGIELRLALTRGEMELFFQPVIDLKTGAIAGAEALLRWNSPTRGMVSPAEFIPIAEDLGLIRPLGAWVLQQACAEAMRWPEHLKVAVNLSPKQFHGSELVREVADTLDSTGLAANRLELEITESVLLQDSAAVLETLHELKSFGARIALDDFGTGYSSLSYLRRFPFDRIKIDQWFVRDITRQATSMFIIEAVITLARKLGMATTAEGIEGKEQLSLLYKAGCTEGQGYLFNRPMRASDFRALVVRASELVT